MSSNNEERKGIARREPVRSFTYRDDEWATIAALIPEHRHASVRGYLEQNAADEYIHMIFTNPRTSVAMRRQAAHFAKIAYLARELQAALEALPDYVRPMTRFEEDLVDLDENGSDLDENGEPKPSGFSYQLKIFSHFDMINRWDETNDPPALDRAKTKLTNIILHLWIVAHGDAWRLGKTTGGPTSRFLQAAANPILMLGEKTNKSGSSLTGAAAKRIIQNYSTRFRIGDRAQAVEQAYQATLASDDEYELLNEGQF